MSDVGTEEAPDKFAELDWMENRLKTIDTITLQNTIAEAVGKLIETELTCSISNIDYERLGMSTHGGKFTVSLSEPAEKFFPNKE